MKLSKTLPLILALGTIPVFAQAKDNKDQKHQGEPRVIEVVATDFEFKPSKIEVAPGEKVQIKLVNQGEKPHNIEFELPSGEIELEEALAPKETGTLTFEAPKKAGKYVLYCPVGMHKDHGMIGHLVVAQGEKE